MKANYKLFLLNVLPCSRAGILLRDAKLGRVKAFQTDRFWYKKIKIWQYCLIILRAMYCVSQKERVRENQRPYQKTCPRYLPFYFWFNMSTTLGSLCKNLLWINQIVLKMWLWTWTQRKLRIWNFCWMPLISQNSLRWKTLSIMSNTKPRDTNMIESEPVMAKVSSEYLFKFPEALLYEVETGVQTQFSK